MKKKIEQLNDFTQQTTNYGILPKITAKKRQTPLPKQETCDQIDEFYKTKWIRFKNSFKPFPVLKVTQNKKEFHVKQEENKFIQYQISPLLRQSSLNIWNNKLNSSKRKNPNKLSIEKPFQIKIMQTSSNPKSQNISNQCIMDTISPKQYAKRISFFQEELNQIKSTSRFKQPSIEKEKNIKFDLIKNLGKYLELNYDFSRLGVRGVALEEDLAEFDQNGVQQKPRKLNTTIQNLQNLISPMNKNFTLKPS